MNTIVLPGFGTPVTFTPTGEDTHVGVMVNGRIVSLNLPANVPTRIEFIKSRSLEAGLAQVA